MLSRFSTLLVYVVAGLALSAAATPMGLEEKKYPEAEAVSEKKPEEKKYPEAKKYPEEKKSRGQEVL
jgi:hypothetical protein